MKKVENERDGDGGNGGEKKKATERPPGGQGGGEGRLRTTSHSSCVTGPCSYNTYIHIQDGSSISHTHTPQYTHHMNYHPRGLT